MFGAPLRDFCLRDVEEKPVVEGFEDHASSEDLQDKVNEFCKANMKEEEPEPVEEQEEEPEQEQEAEESNEEPVEESNEESVEESNEESVEEFGNCGAHKKEEFGNCGAPKKEGFTNRVLFGKRFLSLDLALRAVLYALLFYIVSHSDTQALLKGVVKRLPKVVKPFAPMLLFGVLYYVLNLFI